MNRIMITAARIRSVLDGANTETDAILALRRHRIRYSFSTAGGCLHIRIPSRFGIVAVYRPGPGSAPFLVSAAVPVPYPFPRLPIDD